MIEVNSGELLKYSEKIDISWKELIDYICFIISSWKFGQKTVTSWCQQSWCNFLTSKCCNKYVLVTLETKTSKKLPELNMVFAGLDFITISIIRQQCQHHYCNNCMQYHQYQFILQFEEVFKIVANVLQGTHHSRDENMRNFDMIFVKIKCKCKCFFSFGL